MSGDEERMDWKKCASWLSRCMVLSAEQLESVTCVDHLALCLRDGVLLCLLANRLVSGAIDTKSFSQRPQASQFLCLKNIRVFLQACKRVFRMKDSDLFEDSDLFDMNNLNNVISTLSALSKTKEAKKSGIGHFDAENDVIYTVTPSEEMAEDAIYTDHIYGDSTEDADEEIYGQLVDYHPRNPSIRTTIMSHRDHCVKEILDTENNYVQVLTMIVETFVEPLKKVLPSSDSEVIFRHILELRSLHRELLSDLAKAGCKTTSTQFSAENTIPGCFVKHKMNLVIYGDYCANLVKAQERLDQCLKSERIKAVVEKKNEEAKVKLRDILVVPFQRILKYHLLIQQLLKDTEEDHKEKPILEQALEEMKDVSMYVNEVKRDSENLALISEIENSITDLGKYMQSGHRLQMYGRRVFDGFVKLKAPKDKSFETRYAFLFDKIMLICQSKGSSYNYRDRLLLSNVRLSDHPPEKGGAHCFKIVDGPGAEADVRVYIFSVKTEELKQRWIDSIELAKSNFMPDGCDSGEYKFRMYTFNQSTVCEVCKKLLKGVFFQGYRCQNTGISVHKECIKKATAGIKPNGKVKATAEYNGRPPPPNRLSPLLFNIGDVIVVISIHEDWVQGRFNNEIGYFPRNKVRVLEGRVARYEEPVSGTVNGGGPKPPIKVPLVSPLRNNPRPTPTQKPVRPTDNQPWLAGPISRQAAADILQNKENGTFLIRYSPEKQEYVLSVRHSGTRDNVRHIRVLRNGLEFHLSAVVAFESLEKLVEYYTATSLQESFPNVQTALITPYQLATEQTLTNKEPGVIAYCIALYDYGARETCQLSFNANDRIAILSKTCGYAPLWWRGRLNSKTGYIPSNYVEEL